MNQHNKTGVLLLNLGGPEKQADVEPFLFNLFSDRDIIPLGPPFMQKFIARRIVRKRAPRSRENYRLIGGGSPIRRITDAQARALEQTLGEDFIVRPGMRYWHPFVLESLERMISEGIERVVALPLYPHYSVATTGSSFHDLRKIVAGHFPSLPVLEIRSWPDEPQYISSLAGKIKEGMDRFAPDEPVQVVYSAHSLPQRFIDQGDPYVDEIMTTIGALEAITGKPGKLCFQSRSGPVKWLEPSTPDMLRQLATQGCKNILMVPISFVSDHVETLYEIDILYRDMARDMGMRLESSPGLNEDPAFIGALAALVRKRLAEKPSP